MALREQDDGGKTYVFADIPLGKLSYAFISTNMSCAICVTRKPVSNYCGKCDFTACKTCSQRCVIEHCTSPFGECVSCGTEWNFEHLSNVCGKAWVKKEFRSHRRKRLLLVEKGKMNLSVAAAGDERERRKLKQAIQNLIQQVRAGDMQQLPELLATRRRLNYLNNRGLTPSGVSIRCSNPTCNGYVNDSGKCVTCETVTCKQCGETKLDDAHVCVVEIMQTFQEIQKNCKQCPRCGIFTYKVEGCPVMWCSSCHVFWHWDTRRIIETRRHTPHNPDHRQWLANESQQQRREIDDLPCGGLDGNMLHNRLMQEFVIFHPPDVAPMASIMVSAMESMYAAQRIRHDYPLDVNIEQQNSPHRIAYLLNDIDEEKLATILERQERTNSYKREIGFILEVYVLCGADIFQLFVAGVEGIELTTIHVLNLKDIVNKALHKVSVVYGRTPIFLTHSWQWSTPYNRNPHPTTIIVN